MLHRAPRCTIPERSLFRPFTTFLPLSTHSPEKSKPGSEKAWRQTAFVLSAEMETESQVCDYSTERKRFPAFLLHRQGVCFR